MTAVDFSRTPASPDLDPGASGVVIRVEARSEHGALRALRLHGAYRLSIDEARAIDAVPLHKALVITAVSGFRHQAWNLAGDALAFPDDEQTGGGAVTGYFSADVLPRFPVAAYGRAYLVVSLGAHRSNVVEVVAT